MPKHALNIKMHIELMFLPLAEESLIPVQGCTLSLQCIFCRYFSHITDFEASVFQSVEIFSIANYNLKICCHFVIYMYLYDFLSRVSALSEV